MNISFGTLKILAASDANAEKAHDTYVRHMRKNKVTVSWEDDGLGYIVALEPKQEVVEEEIEERFFSGLRNSFLPAPAF